MKTVFTNSEIVHVWASQKQSTGSANSMRFADSTIYSYRCPIGQFVTKADGSKVVLLDRTSRTVTTSRHQSEVSFAVNHLPSIEVCSISNTAYGADRTNLAWYTSEIQDAIAKASRAVKQWSRDSHLRRANSRASDMLAYSELFELGWVVPTVPTDLAACKIQVKAESKAKAEATRIRNIEQAKKQAELRERWLAGESFQYDWASFMATELRIVGDEIETSRGAKFPISHAKRGLALVDSVIARGELWQRNGKTCHLGHYQIDRIEANGTVHAGCHVVPLASIDRIRESILAYAPANESEAA